MPRRFTDTADPRVGLNSLSTASWTLAQDLALYDRLGVGRAGLFVDKLEAAGPDAAVEQVGAAGLRVDHVFSRGIPLADRSAWPGERTRLLEAVDMAVALGAPILTVTTGPAGPLPWEAAADACGEALGPVVVAAGRRGIRVALEQTLPIRPEIGFVHSFADTLVLARRLGAVAVLEANYAFAERGLTASLAGAGPLLGVVQISDLVPPSTVVPDRAVPGDGVIPLDRLIGQVGAAGYGGPFELELIGPRIEAEGYEAACRRAVTSLSRLLAAADQGPGRGPS
jgi:sugar phosphate isomerase/epimerase